MFNVKVTPAVPSFLIQEWPEFKSGLDAEKIIGAIYHSELMLLMKWYVFSGLSIICLTFLNAWKQMCSAGDSVPRNKLYYITHIIYKILHSPFPLAFLVQTWALTFIFRKDEEETDFVPAKEANMKCPQVCLVVF